MRATIYIKDVEQLNGRSYRSAKHYLSKVRRHYGKQRHQFITLEEFSTYSGVPIREVITHLKL